MNVVILLIEREECESRLHRGERYKRNEERIEIVRGER